MIVGVLSLESPPQYSHFLFKGGVKSSMQKKGDDSSRRTMRRRRREQLTGAGAHGGVLDIKEGLGVSRHGCG